MTSPSHAKARITPARFEALATGLRQATVALCATSVILFAVMIALEYAYYQRLSGGLPSLDIRLTGFSPEEAVAWLTALGDRGRETLLVWQYSCLDLIFPAIFGLALAGLVLHAGRRWSYFAERSEGMQLAFALLVALPYVAANYAQNVFLIRMLADPSAASIRMVSITAELVELKVVLAVAAMLVVAALFMLRGGSR